MIVIVSFIYPYWCLKWKWNLLFKCL